MRARVVSLAFLLVPALIGMAAAAAPTQPSKTGSIPIAGDIQLFQSPRRVMVMMRIGQGELVPMIFDTGSDGHSIDRLIVTRERLRRVGTTREVDGTTGKVRNLPRVVLQHLTLGGLPLRRIEATSLDYDRADAMGIFTPEMFTDNLVYVDLANSVVRVRARAAAEKPAQAPAPYVAGLPGVDMIMPGGAKLPATFDTGFNGALSLPTSMMATVPLMEAPRVVGRFKSINTEGDVFGARVRGTIKIGSVVLENPNVTFLGDVANIGLPIIRQVTLVIDPGNKESWILPAGSKPTPRK